VARFALRLLWMAGGLVLGASLLYALMPVERRERDRDELLRHKDDCQVLLIGPSYVNRLVPAAFDDEAQRIGFSKRMCNLGRVNLRGYELAHELEIVLGHDFPKLELVAIDITLKESLAFDPENWFKPRVIGWHTLGAIPWLARYYSSTSRPLEPLTALSHAGHVAAHYTSLGRAGELFGEGAESVRPDPRRRARPDEPEDEPRPPASHAEKIERLVARKHEIRERRQTLPSRWGEDLRTVTRRHGVDAFFFYSPVWHGVRPPRPPKKDGLVFLDFNDPERYPELYTPDVRGSTDHLNPAGGAIQSRLLARELEKRWALRRVKPP